MREKELAPRCIADFQITEFRAAETETYPLQRSPLLVSSLHQKGGRRARRDHKVELLALEKS